MKERKGFTLIELLVVIAIIAILAAILFPVFTKAKQSAMKSTCQSNLKQLGTAFKSYLTDWDDTFPTNRRMAGNNANNLQLNSEVKLTVTDWSSEHPDVALGVGSGGGPNWVEALYAYTESTTVKEKSPWKCPAASNTTYTTGSNSFKTDQYGNDLLQNTYVMNYYVIELVESAISDTANLMLVREFDRKVGALLRPQMPPSGSMSSKPMYPFLNGTEDSKIAKNTIKSKLHGNGSNILFTDGHVGLFPAEAMMTSMIKQDEYGRWFNSIDSSDSAIKKAIAITP